MGMGMGPHSQAGGVHRPGVTEPNVRPLGLVVWGLSAGKLGSTFAQLLHTC